MHVLIPALLGRPVNQHERDILELPVRCGGLGIINPVRITSREYAYSVGHEILSEPPRGVAWLALTGGVLPC